MRIQTSTPAIPDRAKAEEVLLDILAVRGGRFAGKTLLYKTFYLAHLYFWEENDGVLTQYPVVHMPEGPGIDQGDDLIAGLIGTGRLKREVASDGPYREEVFELLQARPVDPSNPVQHAIRLALDFIGTRNARELCDEIHKRSTAWKRGHSGDELPIYLDVFTDEELGAVRKARQETEALFRAAFGEE
jgi:hypothetical protein